MPSPEAAVVFAENQQLLAAWLADPNYTIDDFRRIFEDSLATLALDPDAEFTEVDAGGVPAIWARNVGTDDAKAIIHFHSGGYVMGSAHGYRSFGANLAEASGIPVLLVDYRLAPENPHPAQLEDALAAFHYLRSQGLAASDIAITGDSAGGGLCLVLLQALRDAGEDLPGCGVAISPWTDFTLSGESMVSNAANDPLVPGSALMEMIRSMVVPEGFDYRNPRVSPLFGDWSGIPPLLLLVGSIEALRDDSARAVEAAQAAGVDAELAVGDGLVHIWPIFADRLPEARASLTQIASFIRKHI
ncbi:MAG: alpha/beta hydrolase [Sporichthyaceae bacterium]